MRTELPTIHPSQPAVLTLKVIYPFPGLPIEEQGRRGRMELSRRRFAITSGRSDSSSTTCSRAPASILAATSPASS